MDTFIIYTALVMMGLALGSFAGATVWRLRARQLKEDKVHHGDYDHNEYKSLEKLISKNIASDRSRCLHCDYTLKWYDLIPVVSWVGLGGKCRKCRKFIGWFEPVIELGLAAFFVLSYLLWPYHLDNLLEVSRLVLWLASGVGLAILFSYDTKWFLLPDRVSFTVVGLGLVSSIVTIVLAPDHIGAIASILGAVAILSGVYFVLYLVSRGKWIGFGDVKLGLGLALLLADWRLAFIALFAANLIGCIIVIPAMIKGVMKRDSHVPFGPLLIVGMIVAQFAGYYLIDAYLFGLV